jgi:hypothetical protein
MSVKRIGERVRVQKYKRIVQEELEVSLERLIV